MSEKNKGKSSGSQGPGGFGAGPGFARPIQKAKDFKGTLKRLIRYLRPHKINLIVVLIFAIASTSFTIYAPKVSSKALNKLQDGYTAKLMLTKMSDAQVKAIDQINQQRSQIQANPKALANQKPVDPETMKAVQEFMKLPMLNKVKDAKQKAEIVRKMIDLGKKMPTNGQRVGQNVKLTSAQIDGTIRAIRETNGKYDFHYIGVIALILIGMYLISAAFGLIMGLVMSSVAQKTTRDLRSEVDNKLARLPLKYFDQHPHGDILSRVTNDIDTISTTLQQSLTQIITSVVTILGYIIMMLTISPVLALIVLATMPLYILSTALIAKKSQKYFASQQKELGQLSGHVEEMYTGHKIVKAFGHEKDAIDEFEGINNRLYNVGWIKRFLGNSLGE